jgi:beta-glucanase (GH16 family)
MVRSSTYSVSAAFCFALAGCGNPPTPEVETWTPPPAGWVEVWRDDFNGPAQSAPDATHWNVEEKAGEYNDELEHYTNDRKNSYVDGAGNLVIQALKESYVDANGAQSPMPYTSARLNTRGKTEQTYGKFEARIKLPAGKGIWPAFWLLGNNVDQAGWPQCGEIDILEMHGSRPNLIDGSLHGPGYSASASYHNSYVLSSGLLSDAFHVYTVEWTPQGVRWLVDGQQYHVKTPEGVAQSGHTWVFDHPFFIILNLAVGGIFDGNPDASTLFPQQMIIDYVSVSKLGQ